MEKKQIEKQIIQTFKVNAVRKEIDLYMSRKIEMMIRSFKKRSELVARLDVRRQVKYLMISFSVYLLFLEHSSQRCNYH